MRPLHGNTDFKVARFGDKAAHAVALVADDDGGRALEIGADRAPYAPSAAVPKTQTPAFLQTRGWH